MVKKNMNEGKKGAEKNQRKNIRTQQLKRRSSMAKAFLPHSWHDVMATPLMKSALVIDIECLQFGHL
jgi:hypothetical protein